MIEDFENFIQVDDSFIVVLDSRNCTINNSTNLADNSNLTFNLQTPIIQPVNTLNLKASVLSFTCPNSQYVINNTNNTIGISFNIAGTPLVNFPSYQAPVANGFEAFYVTVANGNYNPYTFSTALVNSFNILSDRYPYNNGPSLGIFSLDYNEITGRFSLANDRYYFYVSQNRIFNQFFNDVFPSSVFYTIGDVMGFDNTQVYTSTPVLDSSGNVIIDGTTGLPKTPYTLNFPYPVNFGGIQNINIHIENLKTYNIPYQSKNFVLQKNNLQEFSNFSKSNIACSIPVNCPPMSVIFYQKIGQFDFTVKDETIDKLQIVLRDDLGNYLQLNNQNFNLTIEFVLLKHIEKKTRNFYSILSNPYPRFE
jgi:hypothetical protein